MQNMKKWIAALILSLSLIIPQPGWSFDPNSPATSHQAWSDITAIRNNLNDLRKHEIGPSEPGSPVAGMIWVDTYNHLVKVRNEANSGWQAIWDIANNRLAPGVIGHVTCFADGVLTADSTGRAKMADLFITSSKVNDVDGSKITGTNTPSDNTVSTNKLQNNAVTGAKITATVATTSSHLVATGDTWLPSAGVYFFTCGNTATSIRLEAKNGSYWWTVNSNSSTCVLGFAICDGTNVRIKNGSGSDETIYYLKW